MGAEFIIRRLRRLLDVDDTGIAQGDAPLWDVAASKFTMGAAAGSGGIDVTLSGNTAGALALISSGTMTLAGGTNITLSQNGNAVSILGGAGGGGTQTAISGISASDTLYTSGTVRFTGVGGGITVSSNTGQRVDLSVAAPVAQTVQTQNVVDLTLNGNTAGALALISSGTATLAGGNNITLSQAGNAITISGASQSVQSETQTFVGGVANSQTTYTSGTVNLSVVAGNLTIRSTTGQAFQFSASQTVQTQNAVDVTLAGNTSGALALISSGTMTLAGGNNITLSQAGNAVTISGPAAAGAQTAISGIAASNTTYTSGSVTFTGVGGGVTVSSNTGQRVDISVAAPVAQTNQTGSVFAASNTTGTSSGTYDARTLSIAGDGMISVAASNSGWRISATQSVQTQGNLSLGVSTGGNTAGNTTVNTGSRFVLVASGALTASQATAAGASTITLSAATQTAQTQGILNAGVSTAGNTSGDTTVNSGTRLVFVGTNNITLSQGTAANATTVTISGPSVAGAQTGISGIANSQTTYTSGTVSLSELGAITIRSTTGQQFQFSVNAQTGTQFSAGISGGNTSGDTGTVGGRVVFAGGNNVTLSGSTNGVSETITISAFNQSVQPETQTFLGGISNSQTTYTSGTVGLSVVGGNMTIRSTTGNAFQFSVSQSVQAETQTAISGIANSQTTYTSGTVSLSELGAITIRSTTGNQFQFSVNAQTPQTGISGIANSQTTYTSGTVSLSELGAITIRSTTGNQYQFSVNSQTVQTQGILNVALSNIGNTSGDTGINSGTRMVLAGGNNVTLSASSAANATTVTISAANQSVQTQDVLSAGVSTGGNTAGNTTVNTGSRLVFVGTNLVSLSQATAAGASTITLDATNQNLSLGVSTGGNTSGNTTVNSGSRFVIVGSNGITASQGTAAGATTLTLSGRDPGSAGMSTMGNTAGDTGFATQRLALIGGNNITLSGSTNGGSMSISIAAPSPGAAQYSIGVSTGGNTTGNTGVTGTRIVFAGQNNITLSQATDATGATISINNTVSAFQAGVSTGGNTAGDTGVTGTRMVFVGSSPISLSQATGANGGTITVNAPATSSLSGTGGIQISTNGSTISIGMPVASSMADWQNFHLAQATLMTHLSGITKVPFYWNEELPAAITAKSLVFRVSNVTASQPNSFSAHLGVYTLVNSTSAALLGSLSEAYVISSASSVSFSGIRNYVISGIGTHATLSTLSGGEYMFGMMFSATATNAINMSLMGAGSAGGPLGVIFPGTNSMSTGTSQGIQALFGRGSTTVNAMPANVVASELVNQGQGASMQLQPWVYIRS